MTPFLSFHPIPRRLAGRVPRLVLVATCVGVRQSVHPAGQGSKLRRQAWCGGSGGGRESSHPVRRGGRRWSAGGKRCMEWQICGRPGGACTPRRRSLWKAPPPYICSMHTHPPPQRIVFIISSGCVDVEDPRACCSCARRAVGMCRKHARTLAHSRKCRALRAENLRGGRARGYQSCSTADYHRTGE